MKNQEHSKSNSNINAFDSTLKSQLFFTSKSTILKTSRNFLTFPTAASIAKDSTKATSIGNFLSFIRHFSDSSNISYTTRNTLSYKRTILEPYRTPFEISETQNTALFCLKQFSYFSLFAFSV